MRKVLILIVCFLPLLPAYAQKEDYNWILGSNALPDSQFATIIMNFSTDPASVEYYDVHIGFDLASSSLSDSMGNLRCFSNGANIYNNNFEIIENGSEVQPLGQYPYGFPATQSMILLPFINKYILVSGKIKYYNGSNNSLKSGFSPVFYWIVDFSSEEKSGKVEIKNIEISNDTLNYHGITAVRHANGRDWWVVFFKYDSNRYYKILVSGKSAEVYDQQKLGNEIPPGWDHAVFSPDGKWYIRYSWWGTTSDPHSSIYIYNFDRCSGALSNFQSYQLKDDGPGGVAVSPNSRYLYVSNWDTIFQYDLMVPNIFASETVVASYDGFKGEDGWPVRFFTPQLAPDNRIYLCVPNVNSRYLHYIAYPDSAGLACNVVQHGIKLPVYNSNTLPNLPYFKLLKDTNSPCDTIGKMIHKDLCQIKILPNPGGELANLKISDEGLPQSGVVQIYSSTGALVHIIEIPKNTPEISINTTGLSQGLYFYKVLMNNHVLCQAKWVKYR